MRFLYAVIFLLCDGKRKLKHVLIQFQIEVLVQKNLQVKLYKTPSWKVGVSSCLGCVFSTYLGNK